MHNATSLQIIVMELAGADGVRVLKDAPAPSTGTAHSVANLVSFLHSMMDGDDSNLEYTKLAYSATSNSKLSEEERKPCGRNHKKDKQAKARGKRRKKQKRTTMRHQQRTHAPIAKTSNAGSPIASTHTNACGTKNTKNTGSNPSAMSSR